MARLSEQASAEDSKAYRRSVAFFAALGYVWVMACVLVAVLILAYIGKSMWQGQFRVAYAWGLPGAGGLLWTSLQASRCIARLDAGIPVHCAA